MPRSKNLRRRPSTPNIKKLSGSPLINQRNGQQQLDGQYDTATTVADPSPPETPTTSPPVSRKISLKPRHQPPFFDESFMAVDDDPAIRPVGQGHQFSYRPRLRPDQLSPRSSSSSSNPLEDSGEELSSSSDIVASLPDAATLAMESMEDEDQQSGNVLEDDLPSPDASDADSEFEESDSESEDGDMPSSNIQTAIHITSTGTKNVILCDFIIEDVDPMDSDNDELDVLFPTEVESIRSLPRKSKKDHIDNGIMHDLRKLNCSAEASDNENERQAPISEVDYDEMAFLKRREELRRFRRVSMSSSFGKRTHSELSDSDPDEYTIVDVNEVGSSARRLRKRLHRGSLLFHDPPAPRIDELEEPDSSDDALEADRLLAMELPYWTMEIMEVESS